MKILPVSETQYHSGTICVYPHLSMNSDVSLLKLFDKLIEIISRHENVYVVHNGNYVKPSDNMFVQEIRSNIKNIWIRDYSPIWGIANEKLCAVTFQYEKAISNNSLEEALLNIKLSQIFDLLLIELKQKFEGANYLSDGRSIYLCKNPKFKNKQYCRLLEQSFYDIFNTKDITWIPNKFEYDVCRHLDNVCCISSNNEIVFFDQPNNTDFMANIYCFNGGILLSDRYKNNAEYTHMLNKYFPGKTQYFIDIEPLTRLHGGLHCILKEIPQV